MIGKHQRFKDAICFSKMLDKELIIELQQWILFIKF